MDSRQGHDNIDNLDAIRMEFLPSNMASVLQPMDQAIIETTLKLYRRSLLQQVLLSYESGKRHNVDLLEAVHPITDAWMHVHPLSIANCFAHAGLSLSTSSPELATPDFSNCKELCDKVRRLTSCVIEGAESDRL